MTELYIEHLSAGYGKKRILQGVDLRVRGGEIVAVLGENGCGKTTLLRAIGGSIPLLEGTVRVNGTELSSLDVRRRAALVTLMSQESPPQAGLTGFDRIEMSFFPQKGLFGRLTSEEKDRIVSLAREFGMESLLSRDLAAMSTGERQMISLLGAAVQNTPVLLLDEPTSALDFNRTEELFSLLHRMAAQGRAILAVLHDPTLALRHATGILQLGRGSRTWLDLTESDDARIEASLRRLYPHLRIHRDPLFCYTEADQT